MERIGIFAGVFDPIHLGHTAFIKKSATENKLDKVYILIEKTPRYKKCIAGYEHRKEMVRLAVSGLAGVSIYETATESFPISAAVPKIKKSKPGAEIFLLVGDDVKEHMSSWADSEWLLANTKLIVARRNGGGEYAAASSLKIRGKLRNKQQDVDLDNKVLKYCQSKKLY